MEEMRNACAYKKLCGNLQGRDCLESRCRWEDNINVGLEDIGHECEIYLPRSG
jgi:hypothetical protein